MSCPYFVLWNNATLLQHYNLFNFSRPRIKPVRPRHVVALQVFIITTCSCPTSFNGTIQCSYNAIIPSISAAFR